MENNLSIKNKLTEAQMGIISATGKLSGDVQEILISNDETIKNLKNINNNLKDLVYQIYQICYVLNLNFEDIIGEINECKH